MQFSIWPSFERPWSEVAELAAYADRTGWHAFWYADHFMPNTDDDTPSGGDALECWSVHAALAAATSRVRLTSMVSPVTIHHPVTLAKRAVTVDHISGGRVTLGLGAGWQVNEHAAYGFELPASTSSPCPTSPSATAGSSAAPRWNDCTPRCSARSPDQVSVGAVDGAGWNLAYTAPATASGRKLSACNSSSDAFFTALTPPIT